MTVLEILRKIDESIEEERKIRNNLTKLRDYYIKDRQLDKAIEQEDEIKVYNHSIANSILLKSEIERSLDEEASRAYEEMSAND